MTDEFGVGMKKLCVIASVFGRYQGYIPLFVLSWLRAYPYVDIRIYLHDTIDPDVQKSLDLLDVSDHVVIIEDCCKMVALTEKALENKAISKSVRWLLHEPIFMKYEALYIGDIDIVIAYEPISLFEQHMRHCAFIGLPYSNMVRRNPAIEKSSGRELRRLSGLHFVQTKEYIKAVAPVMDSLVNQLNLLSENKSDMYVIDLFNNEMVLYDLVRLAGLGFPGDKPPPSVRTKNKLIKRPYKINPEQVNFRPHHGLHLGLARGDGSLLNGSWSSSYKAYYSDFLELIDTDDYRKIERFFPPFLIEQINKFHEIGTLHKNTEVVEDIEITGNLAVRLRKHFIIVYRRIRKRVTRIVRRIVNAHPVIKLCYTYFMKVVRCVFKLEVRKTTVEIPHERGRNQDE